MIQVRLDNIHMAIEGAQITVPVDLRTQVRSGSKPGEIDILTTDGALTLRGSPMALRLVAKDILDVLRPERGYAIRSPDTAGPATRNDHDDPLADFRPGGTI